MPLLTGWWSLDLSYTADTDRPKYKSVVMYYLSIRFWEDPVVLWALLDIFNATLEVTCDICFSFLDPFTRPFIFSWFGERYFQHTFASLVHFAAFNRTNRTLYCGNSIDKKSHFYLRNLRTNIARLTAELGKKVVIDVAIVTSSPTLCWSVFSGLPWWNFQSKSS